MLIVEDEPDVLLMLSMAFEGAHHDVRLAADGDVALTHLRRERFDIVLLDVMMPVLDGWQVLTTMQGCEQPPPVVVMSAADNVANQTRARDLGAVDFVGKPFQLAQLIERVEGFVPRGLS
jgi:DNA-binding response OmpR family regulator